MNDLQQAFLDAAATACELLDDGQLPARWDEPGASAGLTVGGIATHLVQSGLESFVAFLDAPEPEPSGRLLAPARYFSGQSLDLGHPDHLAIRDGANTGAQAGPEEMRIRAAAAVSTLRTTLAGARGDRLVLVLDRFTMTLDDLTITRLVEVLAHCDDLASSLALPYEPPAPALTFVLPCLTDVARRRHGDRAVLRALTRGDRVTDPVFPVF